MARKSAAQQREDRMRDESVVARDNFAAYEVARDLGEHEKYIKRAVKCDDFFRGEQWDDNDVIKLEAEGRPHLTINIISSTVKAILGQHSTQRADIIFKPKKNTTQDEADIMTKLVMNIQDTTKYGVKEAQVYSDGIIQDRGYFDVRMNFKESLTGDIQVTAEDPIDILLDPGAKEYDPSTWKQVIKTRWMTLDDIEEVYGKDKRDDVELTAKNEEFSHDCVRYNQKTFGDMDKATAAMYTADDKVIRRIRVVERQYYKFTRVRYLVDRETGDMRSVPQTVKDNIVKKLATEMGYQLITKRGRKVRWTVSAAGTVLKDTWSPYRSFTIIPFFPIFRRGRPVGAVYDLLSPQEQLNKVESQQLHVVNTTANSGWIVEENSLANMTAEELEKRGAETGLVVVHRKNRTAPTKITANGIPTGLDRLGSKASDNLRLISGVGSLLGAEGPEVSGVAIGRKQQRGMVQLQPIIDNLNYTRSLVADKFLELIQDFYTETRIIRVTNWQDPRKSEEEVVINQPDGAGNILNNVTLGEYDVTVSSAPTRDNFEESQFAEAIELRNAGVMIPDHHIIPNTHLANKYDIAEEVKQMQGLGEKTPEQQEFAQMQLEAEIQNMQLELAEKGAKVEKLQAEAMKMMAQAEKEQGEAQRAAQEAGAKLRLDMQKMQSDIIKTQASLINKLELAQLHINANKQQTLYTETSKRMMKALEARNKPQQSANA